MFFFVALTIYVSESSFRSPFCGIWPPIGSSRADEVLCAADLRHFAREIPPDGLGASLVVASAAVRPGLRRQPDLWPFSFDDAADSVSSIGDRRSVAVRLAFYAIFLENADI